MATSTPWGQSQYSKKLTRGIVFYSTSSHGGFHVSPGMLKKMPEHLKAITPFCARHGVANNEWFEEDCDWAIVCSAFPQFFSEENRLAAVKTMNQYYPEVVLPNVLCNSL